MTDDMLQLKLRINMFALHFVTHKTSVIVTELLPFLKVLHVRTHHHVLTKLF